jgi:probable addiction module antidote protein
MPKSRSYKEDLLKALQDDEEAAAYLDAALEADDYAAFLVALRNVAEAQEGVAVLSQKTGLNRESLYRTLSEKGNPVLSSLTKVLQALGYRLSVTRMVQTAQHISTT